MAAPTRSEVLRSLDRFAGPLGIGVAVLIAIHLLPKNIQPNDELRQWYTVAYFAALGLIGWQLWSPRRAFFETWIAWRYDDAPPAVQRSAKRLCHEFDVGIRFIVTMLGLFGAGTAILILGLWFEPLKVLHGVANLAWWIGIIGTVVALLVGADLGQRMIHLALQLSEQIALTAGVEPRSLAALVNPQPECRQTGLELRDQLSFQMAGDTWRWEDLQKSCVVFGQPGSGKTSCVLNSLLDGLLGSATKAGKSPAGLILDPKGDFMDKLPLHCERYGREADLLILDPTRPLQSIRWNPLDSDDNEQELAARFTAIMEALGTKGGETSFWLDSSRKFLRNALTLLRLTNPAGEPPSFRQLYDLATSPQSIAERTCRLIEGEERAEVCLAYFAGEWTELAPETRSGIQAHVTNLLDPFLLPPYSRMFSGRSSCRLSDVIQDGRLLYVHMPVADQEAMARTIGTFVKLEYYREVLKQLNKSRPSFFLCDEFQVFFTSGHGKGDAEFFERSRQSNHVNLIATQNLSALLRQAPQPEPANSLLGNCATKIFLRNTDQKTNEYAATLFGREIIGMCGSNRGGDGPRRRMFGGGFNIADQEAFVVGPERFADLAVPGANRAYCEAFVHRAADELAPDTRRKRRWPLHLIA